MQAPTNFAGKSLSLTFSVKKIRSQELRDFKNLFHFELMIEKGVFNVRREKHF